jgi:hypothetical protein
VNAPATASASQSQDTFHDQATTKQVFANSRNLFMDANDANSFMDANNAHSFMDANDGNSFMTGSLVAADLGFHQISNLGMNVPLGNKLVQCTDQPATLTTEASDCAIPPMQNTQFGYTGAIQDSDTDDEIAANSLPMRCSRDTGFAMPPPRLADPTPKRARTHITADGWYDRMGEGYNSQGFLPLFWPHDASEQIQFPAPLWSIWPESTQAGVWSLNCGTLESAVNFGPQETSVADPTMSPHGI